MRKLGKAQIGGALTKYNGKVFSSDRKIITPIHSATNLQEYYTIPIANNTGAEQCPIILSRCFNHIANALLFSQILLRQLFCPTPSVASSAIRQANDRGCGRQFHDFVIVTIKREIVTFAIV